MKTYKEKSKGHTTLTVVVNPKFENDYQDTVLRELSEVTDIFFVFSKSESRNKRLRKFSNLYGATYYGVQEWDETESDIIYEALEYGKELGEGYLGFFVVLDNKKLVEERLGDIKRLGESLIETSVWTSRRSTLQDFMSIYTVSESFWTKFFGGDSRNDISRMYETHDTDDPILFLREITLTQLDEYFKDHQVYRESFRKSSFSSFITSATEKICPKTKINLEIKDAKA